MEIWEQVVNGVIIGIMASLTVGVHLWWWNTAKRLNEEWAETCKKQSERWVEHVQKIEKEWSESAKRINKDWREVSTKVLEEQAEAREKLNESWQNAVLGTMDRLEDRYFKYTMKVTEARRLPGERS